MIPWLLLHVLSAIVLAVVCYRLLVIAPSKPSLRCRLRWHLAVTALVMIGGGMCARLLQLPEWAALLTTAGLALHFGVRWRRSGDQ